MPDFALQLPKDELQLCQVLAGHAERCNRVYLWRRMNWLLAWYYMNGYRRFDVFDPQTGRIAPHYVDKEGQIKFQSQELAFAINQVAGRIQSMDLSPTVTSQIQSLSGMRDKAVGQLTLDSMISQNSLRRVVEDFAYTFSCLGFCGLSGEVHEHPTVGLTAELSIVHPRELYPFPAVGYDHTRTGGFMRQHWVPVSFLKDRHGSRLIGRKIKEMEWVDVAPGDMWSSPGTEDTDLSSPITSMSTRTSMSQPSDDPTDMAIARVRELWLYGPDQTVRRYILASGNSVLVDRDLSDYYTYPSVSFSRFMNNGSWYGMGMFDLLFSIHHQLEKMSASLYQNITDLDKYGILVLPQGQLPQQQILKDVGNGLRVMFWEPDPIGESIAPMPIQPWNTGDMPGKVAAFAREAMHQVNPITDIIEEKGRVDSSNALNILQEEASRALTSPTNGVAEAFSGLYRGLHQKALSKITGGVNKLPLANITLDLLGAVINNEEGTISFQNNPLPDITRLVYNIRTLTPKLQAVRKAEILELWNNQLNTDRLSIQLQAYKDGVDLAMYSDDIRNAIEMGTRAILTLYGDGETPGRIILTPHTTKPEVVLRLLETVMVGPAFMYASPQVQTQFVKFRFTLQQWLGLMLPEGVPSMDEAASQKASLSLSA